MRQKKDVLLFLEASRVLIEDGGKSFGFKFVLVLKSTAD